ncbi:MAG: hypothetical protein UV71_C0017G0011 [Microgenomates group bacterium GW2011_GWC1_43_13]|nr:MAG: hypothetical protein UV71_C0017G0011 [Microgenomates group bacterium GW2011_GWC1_43_13]KKT33214.1 MAG: hypothetical protein UW20_C0004G0048 [Candidatus Woesebacteria bacterium GW2011_GWB1_44_11]KKT54384.1 MAG: hypothetical protein UW47_C0006G0032 [Candidatus Woesebacteria bacterium GW2011_GWA1_44_23]
MGVIISGPKDKQEYYKAEAEKLRRQADEVEKIENYPEAKRLRALASQLDTKAEIIEDQLKSI